MQESLSIVSALVAKMSDANLAHFEREVAKLPGNEFEVASLRIVREEIQKRDDADCARAEASEGYALMIGAAKPFGIPAGHQPICDNGGLLRWPIPALQIAHPALAPMTQAEIEAEAIRDHVCFMCAGGTIPGLPYCIDCSEDYYQRA